MKRRRGLIFMLLIACLGLGGLTMRQWSVSAQASRAAKPVFQDAPPALEVPSGHPVKPAQRKAVLASINAQLQAFARNDFDTAIRYQSASLRGNFPTSAAFRQMISSGYPQFAHAKKVVFGPAITNTNGQHVAIPVTLTGQDGVTVRALYLMVLEGKIYHIEGVAGGTPHAMPPGFVGKDIA